jgi:ATP-dependent helicase/nuclease subunit B
MSATVPRVFTIPPDDNFAKVLVEAVLSGVLAGSGAAAPEPVQLADWTILVPTRRAARALATAFGDEGRGGASLLPVVRPLGDANEDELGAEAVLSGTAELDVAPAISGIRRQFVLAGMIQRWAQARPESAVSGSVGDSASQALALAASLGELIDSFDTDEVDLAAIKPLFEQDLALHREDLLAFLDIVREAYPAYLAEHGLSGPMQRRSRLIRAQAKMLAARPPGAPVIAAGSTGSIPATAELLKTIAYLPSGAVVLPGLDLDMDAESWDALEPQHPQFGFKELLGRIGLERDEVRVLSGERATAGAQARRWLLSEVMRPSSTSERWHETVRAHAARLPDATAGLSWLEAPEQHSEALSLAMIMRHALDAPERTAALVTPDRQLARKVKSQLQRWSIEVDDSAGEPALRTPAGSFLLLLCDAALARFQPAKLLALLQHPYALFGLPRGELSAAAQVLEIAVLRGRMVAPGLAGLKRAGETARASVNSYSHRLVRDLDDDGWQQVFDLIARLEDQLALLEDVFASDTPCPLDEFVTHHIRTGEAVTTDADMAVTPLWQGEAGEVLSALFAGLKQDAASCPALLARDYAVLVRRQMAAAPVRPRHVRHPRLAIYGLLEARLVRADVTILGGLNEGVWPGEPEIDPWLNRPQKRQLSLQVPERRLGLMAHDFVQAAAGSEVWLTSSRKIDGQPAVASRWLLRLKALLKASGRLDDIRPKENWAGWALGLDEPDGHTPVSLPRPAPPVEARPERLSVTRIDRLRKDPYGIYAGHILRLDPLEPLEAVLGNRERGTLVHAALEQFSRRTAGGLGGDAVDVLMQEIETQFAKRVGDEAAYAFWEPRMRRMAEWFVARERDWRRDLAQQLLEQRAEHAFEVVGRRFTINCVADRVDVLSDASLRLIDYKTGTLPAVKPGSDGYSAQLDLEAYMAGQGAFGAAGAAAVTEMAFVRLSGGDPPGEVREIAGDIGKRAEDAFVGLCTLLADYNDPNQPYLVLDRPGRDVQPFDFDHLSRWREWGHLRDREVGS